MIAQDFDYLRRYLKERSGLVLSADKQYLAESRLLPVARKYHLADLGLLTAQLRAAPNGPLGGDVIAAMMTNESFFFRDKLPFDYFKVRLLPALVAARSREKRVRIWCAAASTGQEPYSLAMILHELGPALAGWRVELLATDIANDVLEKARSGIYSQFEVQRGLPIQQLVRHFNQTGDVWQIASDIRGMVTFKVFNLLNDFAALGVFDIVFCRNVLIYFDQPTKSGVLNRLGRVVAPDGYLVLGAAETVVGLTENFSPMPDHRGVYVPKAARVMAPPLAPEQPRPLPIPRVIAGGER
ncbi:MAG: chemotaxis protein CheR [Pseudolabrys sp.]|nr:chemotaxis protein CheR [Pseudolabrys sp.]MBV9954085.1 chemotaxis protein CheR [Pseudolabrys sp.]